MVGLLSGIAAVITSMQSLLVKNFEMPCYISVFLNEKTNVAVNALNCCGSKHDISLYNMTCLIRE